MLAGSVAQGLEHWSHKNANHHLSLHQVIIFLWRALPRCLWVAVAKDWVAAAISYNTRKFVTSIDSSFRELFLCNDIW